MYPWIPTDLSHRVLTLSQWVRILASYDELGPKASKCLAMCWNLYWNESTKSWMETTWFWVKRSSLIGSWVILSPQEIAGDQLDSIPNSFLAEVAYVGLQWNFSTSKLSSQTSVTFYFPSMNFFKNSNFVLDEFLWILKNLQHVHEQFFRILVKFFRILYSFLRISDSFLWILVRIHGGEDQERNINSQNS